MLMLNEWDSGTETALPARRRLTRFVYYLVEVLLGPGSAGTPSPVAGKQTPLAGPHVVLAASALRPGCYRCDNAARRQPC